LRIVVLKVPRPLGVIIQSIAGALSRKKPK
jgi:hypothetical protein